MTRLAHFLLTAATAVSGVVLEVVTVAPGIGTHIGAAAPLILAAAKWVHAEITGSTSRPGAL